MLFQKFFISLLTSRYSEWQFANTPKHRLRFIIKWSFALKIIRLMLNNWVDVRNLFLCLQCESNNMVFCNDPQWGFTYAQSCWGLAAREQHPFELTKAKYWIRSCALFILCESNILSASRCWLAMSQHAGSSCPATIQTLSTPILLINIFP